MSSPYWATWYYLHCSVSLLWLFHFLIRHQAPISEDAAPSVLWHLMVPLHSSSSSELFACSFCVCPVCCVSFFPSLLLKISLPSPSQLAGSHMTAADSYGWPKPTSVYFLIWLPWCFLYVTTYTWTSPKNLSFPWVPLSLKYRTNTVHPRKINCSTGRGKWGCCGCCSTP